MDAALTAASNGVRGANPLVGAAVLTPEGHIVTGHHRGAGTPHAEVDVLLRARQDDIDLSTATLLVTLEPCNHTGRTGPCSQLIVDSGIRSVVFAIPDPNPAAGGGAATLRAAGITVRQGLRTDAARDLNARWLAAAHAGRPYVTAKIAQSLDGYAAATDGTSQWITGEQARARGHEFRSRVSAIVVGTGTALADNPRLSARTATGTPTAQQPVPVVIGSREISRDSHLANNPALLLYRPDAAGTTGAASQCESAAQSEPATHSQPVGPPVVTEPGTGDRCTTDPGPVDPSPVDPGPVDPGAAASAANEFLQTTLRDLRSRGHDHVLIEGGPTLVGSLLQADLVDSLLVFTAPVLLGTGIPSIRLPGIETLADALRLRPDPAAAREQLGPDTLTQFIPTRPARRTGPG